MGDKKSDRRSQRTQKLLHDALISLMLEKRYDRITVQDIIDRANIGRSTFYAHFLDKEDLLINSINTMLDYLHQSHDSGAAENQRILPVVELFSHIQEQHRLFEALMRGKSIDLFLEKIQAFWNIKIEEHLLAVLPKGQSPLVPLPLISNWVTSTLISMLMWWTEQKMPYTPEKMDEFFWLLVMPGIRSALQK